MDSIAREIVEMYSSFEEHNRLDSAFGQLEKARIEELLLKNITRKYCKIIDIGGATGPYSFFLASNGYKVHLMDIVEKHIEKAKEIQTENDSALLESIKVGDARDLEYKDNEFDIALLHGPLYHLPDYKDRKRVLQEVNRVLRKNGKIICVTINRYAGLNYGIYSGDIYKDDYYEMIKNEINNGLRKNPPQWMKSFKTAYFHTLGEIEKEIEEVGFKNINSKSVMGTVWSDPEFEENWKNKEKRKRIMEVAKLFENQPTLGPRIFTTAKK